jgi:hypothetical protein
MLEMSSSGFLLQNTRELFLRDQVLQRDLLITLYNHDRKHLFCGSPEEELTKFLNISSGEEQNI